MGSSKAQIRPTPRREAAQVPTPYRGPRAPKWRCRHMGHAPGGGVVRPGRRRRGAIPNCQPGTRQAGLVPAALVRGDDVVPSVDVATSSLLAWGYEPRQGRTSPVLSFAAKLSRWPRHPDGWPGDERRSGGASTRAPDPAAGAINPRRAGGSLHGSELPNAVALQGSHVHRLP